MIARTIAALTVALFAGAAAAELRPVLPGTKLDWSCTGDWDTYSEEIVSADDRELVKTSWVDGKKHQTTRRAIWLRGSNHFAQRDYHTGNRGPQRASFDWDKLRGFADMQPGWSASGEMGVSGTSGGKSWRDTIDFTVRHVGWESYASPVYGEIDVLRTTGTKNWGGGAEERCEALIFPDDAVQVWFTCAWRTRRGAYNVTCDLKDRY